MSLTIPPMKDFGTPEEMRQRLDLFRWRVASEIKTHRNVERSMRRYASETRERGDRTLADAYDNQVRIEAEVIRVLRGISKTMRRA